MGKGARRGYPVTSWSVINSLGSSTEAVRTGLRRGLPALSPVPEGTPFDAVCGAVDPNLASLPDSIGEFDSRNSRFIYHALAELDSAITAVRARWGAARIGICVGSSTASMDEIEAAFFQHADSGTFQPDFDVLASGSAYSLLRVLRAITHFEGPASVVSNAYASSGKAFASAQRWLDAGVVDAVLVGGADSLCQMTLRGFRSLGLLCEGASRPFSQHRSGINIGEGAAFALLEREGEGPRLLGAGESSDAHHMTRPIPRAPERDAPCRSQWMLPT